MLGFLVGYGLMIFWLGHRWPDTPFMINSVWGVFLFTFELTKYYHHTRIKKLVEDGLITLEIAKILHDIERGL